MRSLILATCAVLAAGTVEARCRDHARLKNAYFGDLHTHTSYSLDAYTFGTRTDPAQGYAFATGSAVDIGLGFDASAGEVPGPLGVTIAPSGGALDFDAITDHSESLSTDYGCTADPSSPFYSSAWCTALRANDDSPPGMRPCRGFTDNGATGCLQEQTNAWAAENTAAENANQPCTFTSFHGYEWTYAAPAAPGDRETLHQIVIFANATVPSVPVDAFDYPTAPVMWAGLSNQCHAGIGCEALTIPHNMNQSNGQAFDSTGYTPIDLNRLMKYRKLAEIHQHKGNSECVTDTSDTGVVSNCNFEVVQQFAMAQDVPGYARPAMEAGLTTSASQGYTPAKLGFVGATDSHNATPGRVDEATYTGHIGARDNQVLKRLTGSARNNPGGITGVWAEENTRAAIFAALKRRESFATSGPRIRVRFYQYLGVANPCSDPNFPKAVVDAGGVTMGGTLKDTGTAPSFVVFALQDQTALAAVDIVKASVVGGVAEEKVYAIPLAETPYCVTWTDPDFNVSEPAFWYARVKEQATWRWSHYDCAALMISNPSDWQTLAPGCAPGGGLDVQVQEHAWTSAIWHLPSGPVTIRSSSMRLKDGSVVGDPTRRRFTFTSVTRRDAAANRIVPPAAGSGGDPTLGGATLQIYNPESGETYTQGLTATRWTYDTRANRYTFTDSAGPISKVTVRNDHLSVTGGGGLFGYSLDEARQGTVAIRLQLGTATPWCAESGARTGGRLPTTARYDKIDSFTGKRSAPPPDQCPLLP